MDETSVSGGGGSSGKYSVLNYAWRVLNLKNVIFEIVI